MANNYISLELAKKQVRVDLDDDYDDTYIELCSDIAVNVTEDYINDTFERYVLDYGALPDTLLGAALLMLGQLYDNRSATISTGIRGVQELPLGFEFLAGMHRRYEV